MNIKEMFNSQLRELRNSTKDQELIAMIDAELQERFETLDFMYTQIN
ncbi:hypothetical protein [Robertmurraya siralis]|nr:hypothetical protein [Robertmurraya siralis]